jgi:hypothetical protein
MTDFNSTVLKSADQIIVEESHRRGRIVVERFRWAVRPIYLRRFGRIQHLASCTLLRVGDVPLIITAAHVIDKHSHEVELLIGGRNEIVQLEGRFQSTTLPDDDRAKDHHDFSVARISDSLLPDLGEDSLILEDAVSLGRVVDKPRVYHCVGFTNSRNKDIRAREAKCKLWTFYLHSKSREHIAESWYNDREHLFLAFDRRHTRNPSTGAINNTINPQGSSGGAVFSLGDFDSPEGLRPMAVWEPRLVGIIIEKSAQNTSIVAVRINVVLAAALRVGILPK